MYDHNKAQQSKNRVHISWDILYIRYNLDLSDPPNPQPQPHLHPAPNPNPSYTPPHPQSNFVSQCLIVKYWLQ